MFVYFLELIFRKFVDYNDNFHKDENTIIDIESQLIIID